MYDVCSGLGVGIAAHALMMDGVSVQITGESYCLNGSERSILIRLAVVV